MTPIDKMTEQEWLQLVAEALSMPDAPPHVVQAALDLWNTQGSARPVPSSLRRWFATLRSDSWATAPLASGVRAVSSPVRQLLFTTPDRDVDVRIAPSAEGFAVSGQHLGPDDSGHIELRSLIRGSDPGRRHGAALNALGEFRLEGVRRGTYLLILHLASDEIVLPPIDIGPPQDSATP